MTAFSKDDLHIFEIQLWKSSERNLLICFRQREKRQRDIERLVIWNGLYIEWNKLSCWVKVSENPFKQNKNMLKNKTVLLYTYIYNIFLNVLRPTSVNVYNLPFLVSPVIGKIEVKVGPKNSYFPSFMSSCTNRIAVFNIFFTDM